MAQTGEPTAYRPDTDVYRRGRWYDVGAVVVGAGVGCKLPLMGDVLRAIANLASPGAALVAVVAAEARVTSRRATAL